MKRYAIFNYSGIASNIGGPSGYLSHLKSGFTDEFPDLLYVRDVNKKTPIKKNTKSSTKGWLSMFYELRCIISFIKKGIAVRNKYKNQLDVYNLIHVHGSEDLFYLKMFARYKGIIVLTSHRPEELSDEVINNVKTRQAGSYHILKMVLEYIEKYSYRNADAFIFPSRHAACIYERFPGFNKYSNKKPIRYVTTGLQYKKPIKSREEYFKQHNINLSPNKQIVTYIGRHNKIKGYDRVVEAFEIVKSYNGSVIVAGAPGTIQYPKDPDWVELGYINDAIELMNISDIVVIPNRNTYFDLVIIEALSVGCIVITSNTGGNIDIAKDTKGLVLFDNNEVNGCSNAIQNVLKMDADKRTELSASSLEYYYQNCTPPKFAANYQQAINSIIKELS